MYKYIVIDSEYCSMGRWISVIVGATMKMKLYEGKDLVKLADEEWLSEAYLQDFDERLANMSLEEVKASDEMKRVHQALSKAIKKAVEIGPCIIHERAGGEILKDRDDCLKVLLYNTNVEHKIPRAIGDKSFSLEGMSNDEIKEFMNKQDYKRKAYRDAVADNKWGQKESYDLCLDSDLLSREKCAEILIEALKDVSLDNDECAKIIDESFTWSK